VNTSHLRQVAIELEQGKPKRGHRNNGKQGLQYRTYHFDNSGLHRLRFYVRHKGPHLCQQRQRLLQGRVNINGKHVVGRTTRHLPRQSLLLVVEVASSIKVEARVRLRHSGRRHSCWGGIGGVATGRAQILLLLLLLLFW